MRRRRTPRPRARFTYNPAHPTPTIGGRLLAPEGGYRKDAKLAERPDVLCFTGDRLPADLYVVGTPVIELSHSCDNPYHDLFVRVSEVDAKGVSRNVSDGYRRGTTGFGRKFRYRSHRARCDRAPVPRRIANPGLVAGGSHPRFARNLGTSEPLVSGRELMVSTHTVHLGDGGVRGSCCPRAPQPPSAH